MALHATSRRHDRSRITAAAVVLVVVAAMLSLSLLARADTSAGTGATQAVAQFDTPRTIACAGSSVEVARPTPSSVHLSCRQGVSQVGTSRSWVAARSGDAQTALPAGTTTGTLLITSVQTSATSQVSVSGWTNAYDAVSGTGTRLSVWWRLAAADQPVPVARVTPAARVSMITLGFAGADVDRPVAAAAGAAGLAVPRLGTRLAGGLLLLSLAAQGPRVRVTQPGGVTDLGTVSNGTDMKTSQAVLATRADSPWPGAWRSGRASATVAGVLSVRPVAGAVPAGATAVAGGGSLDVSCGTRVADYSAVNSTVVTVTCRPQAPAGSGSTGTSSSDASTAGTGAATRGIQTVGRSLTFVSGSSGAPHTTLPDGATTGDLLVSVVSTYQFASVTFGAGWVTAYDVSTPSGVHLVAAWKPVGAGDSAVTATVSPDTQVSMATAAFRHVDLSAPVEAAKAAPGAVSPGVVVQTSGALLVLSHASTAWQYSPSPPANAQLAAEANNGGNSEVAVAVQASAAIGATPGFAWPAAPASSSVATGTLAIRPAVPGSAPGVVGDAPSTTGSVSAGSSSVATSTSVVPSTTSAAADPATTVTVAPPAGSAPGTPRPVCGSATLAGPSTAPAGAVSLAPTQNLGDVVAAHPAHTTYWLAPGTYRLGTGAYDQVIPHSGDTVVAAPGAILDGQHKNLYAFTGSATDVTISHLTVQNFGAAGQNNNEGVVNHDAAKNWTITANTIQANAGSGLMIGSGDRVTGNCIRNNGQYAFNAYSPDGVSQVVLDSNEISGNNTDDWEARQPGCGCTGGGKFWATNGATVTNNYVHDNKGVGLWADTNNANFLFQGNYISGNDAEGLMYETSYNAAIINNTFVRNALVKGPTNPGFPASAIYLSESGSDTRVAGPYGASFRISGNMFTDNWAGIIAWENADRFAGSPANTSSGTTTLVNPTVATEAACATASTVAKAPYLDDCRWKTQNVQVDHNSFTLNATGIAKCTAANGCGFNGLFSNYGTYPNWSPYKGEVVQDHLTLHQNNLWQNNTYRGPWGFIIKAGGNVVPWATWRAAPYGQDAGSTLS